MSDMRFARTITVLDLGVTAASIMTECETYGMTYGCKPNCPVFERGECEIQEENEEQFKY